MTADTMTPAEIDQAKEDAASVFNVVIESIADIDLDSPAELLIAIIEERAKTSMDITKKKMHAIISKRIQDRIASTDPGAGIAWGFQYGKAVSEHFAALCKDYEGILALKARHQKGDLH